MFRTLHKTLALLWLAVLAAGGWWIYDNGLVQDAWWICANSRENPDMPPPVTGQVTGVISANEFYLELTNRLTYRMTLSGVKTPRLRKGLTPENAPARLLLDGLINQKTVTVHHGHFGRNHYGKGYVEVAGTNVARAMIASRQAALDREQIRSLSFQEQFGLLHAERKARP